jgi:hypothetical protein
MGRARGFAMPWLPEEQLLREARMKIIQTLLAAITLMLSASAIADEAPTEFVTQLLEPIGGTILRPKDWFYAESHAGSNLRWLLSREDTAGHKRYETGFSLSIIPNVKEHEGKSARQLVYDLLDAQKRGATRFIQDCKEQQQGIFTRVCLETEKGGLHLLFTFFWVKDMDLAVLTVASTTKDQWQSFAPTFDKMAAFELGDLQRFALAEGAPTEFVTQVLEPTGGTILRPKNWFYAEKHNGPSYVWELSREDPLAGKPYETGLSIQTFSGMKARLGKTAEQFMLAIRDLRVKAATKVLSSCDPKDQGIFTRVCLETEERGFHVSYSFFWGSHDEDIAVLVTAGAPLKLWDTYAPTFGKMGEFQLIDLKRFQR